MRERKHGTDHRDSNAYKCHDDDAYPPRPRRVLFTPSHLEHTQRAKVEKGRTDGEKNQGRDLHNEVYSCGKIITGMQHARHLCRNETQQVGNHDEEEKRERAGDDGLYDKACHRHAVVVDVC